MAIDWPALTLTMIRTAPDAVRVVVGSTVTYGLLDQNGGLEATEGGTVPITERTLTVARGALGSIAQDATVTVTRTGLSLTLKIRSPALPVENGDMDRYLVTVA